LGSDKHIKSVYNESNSWTLCHNLFADVWLGTEVVESWVYDGHSAIIRNFALARIYIGEKLVDIPLSSDGPTEGYTISRW